MKALKKIIFTLGSFIVVGAYADQNTPASEPVETPAVANPWAGTNASLGGVLNTGNSASQNLTTGANLQYVTGPWTYTAQGTFQRAESSADGLTAQKLYLLGQTKYNFTEKDFGYTQVNYTDDRFSGYSYMANWQIGYGRHFMLPQKMTLDLYAGPGIRQSETDAGDKSTLPSLQVGANYAWPINTTTSFTEQLQSTAASNDIFTSSQTSLTTNLTDKLAFQFGFLITHDSKPQDGKDAINSTTTVQLVYNF